MLTTGFKLFMGYCLGALAAAAVFGYTTGGNHLGPLTVGWKGAVGEHIGYTRPARHRRRLRGDGARSLVAFRDADARAAAAAARRRHRDRAAPHGPELLADHRRVRRRHRRDRSRPQLAVFVAGLVVLAIVMFEWTMQAWADRATGDPEVNRELRDRIMQPIEVPVGAVIAIVGVPLAASRVFLSVSKLGAVWVATGVATAVLIVAIVLALKPKLSKNVVAGVVLVGGIAFVAAGIVAAAVGERHIEHHGTEHTETTGEQSEEGGS